MPVWMVCGVLQATRVCKGLAVPVVWVAQVAWGAAVAPVPTALTPPQVPRRKTVATVALVASADLGGPVAWAVWAP